MRELHGLLGGDDGETVCEGFFLGGGGGEGDREGELDGGVGVGAAANLRMREKMREEKAAAMVA